MLNVVTPQGLEGGYNALKQAVVALENNCFPFVKVVGEPNLGKRGLNPTLGGKNYAIETRLMRDLITWSDGSHSLLEIAELCGAPIWDLFPIVDRLVEHNLLELR